jgi:hypothetical protein
VACWCWCGAAVKPGGFIWPDGVGVWPPGAPTHACVAAVDVVPQGRLSALVGSRGLQVVALVAPVAWVEHHAGGLMWPAGVGVGLLLTCCCIGMGGSKGLPQQPLVTHCSNTMYLRVE